MNDQQKLHQEALYAFPYHYIPTVESGGVPRITRSLGWGIEYLTYMQVIRQEIENIILKGEVILDIGCGDGYLLNNLGPNFDKYGIDLSARAIAFAQAFATDAIFEEKDIFSLTSTYDIVTCIEVLEHIPDDLINAFVDQAVKLTKFGGHFIVSVPTPVYPLNKKHYRHYDEALLNEHLGAHHSLVLVKEKRIYRVSLVLKTLIRLLNNNIWTVNYRPLLKAFWKWHSKYNIVANQRNGAHLLRVYKKV